MSSRWAGVNPALSLTSVLALVAGIDTEARAANESTAPVSAAFAAMMAHPADPDLAVRYARVAAEHGQTRAAIAALERVLRLHPELDNIRLSLASLYYTDNPALASVYAERALTARDIPQDVADQGRALLNTATAASSRSKLIASAYAGLRHDSDANQATSLATIGVFSPLVGNIQVPTPVRSTSDWSSTLNVQLSHSYDLGLQREGVWETNASGLDQRFFHINHRYDLEAATLDTGPRIGFDVTDGIAMSARPFSTATWLGYGDRTFATLFGGGVSLRTRIGRDWSVDLTGTTRFGNYVNSGFRPSADLYTGVEASAAGTIAYAVSARTRAVLGLTYYHANARAAFNARSGPGTSLVVASEQTVADRLVGLNVHAGIQHIAYRVADPLFGLPDRRTDPIVDAGIAMSTPIYQQQVWAVAQYDFTRDNSSYPAYRFGDHVVSLGIRWSL